MVFIDTDLAISFLSNRKNSITKKAKIVMQHLFNQNLEINLTIFNYAELIRGAYISSKVAQNLRIVEEFIKRFKIVPFTNDAAGIYAKIYADLKKRGESIGDFDELISSIIISHEDVLYTRNIAHFRRVNLLKIKNWAEI